MGSLWERLTVDGAEARLRGGSELPVAKIVERLEAAGSAGIRDLAAADLLASFAFAVLGGHDALGPPLNQQAPPRPRLETALEEPALARLLAGSSRPARLALAAGLLGPVQIGYRFLSLFRASALPLDALINGKVRTLPSTSRVNWPERITEVATRT